MTEMLGNQYFMARNFTDAVDTFEHVLEKYPDNVNVRKKLIICYTQTGKFQKASNLFFELISENPDYIINTDPLIDDCPCPELVNELEVKLKYNVESFTTFEILSILWLYCDLEKSIENFEKALTLKPNDAKVNSILVILKRKLIDNKNNQAILGSYPS